MTLPLVTVGAPAASTASARTRGALEDSGGSSGVIFPSRPHCWEKRPAHTVAGSLCGLRSSNDSMVAAARVLVSVDASSVLLDQISVRLVW